jgi:hypothetical protein
VENEIGLALRTSLKRFYSSEEHLVIKERRAPTKYTFIFSLKKERNYILERKKGELYSTMYLKVTLVYNAGMALYYPVPLSAWH